MDVNFFSQNPYMLSWSGMFRFYTLFKVALIKSRCMFTSGLVLCSCISFFMLLIHLAFLLCSLYCHILYQIVLLLLHLVVGMSSCILHQLVGKIFFHYFEGHILSVLLDLISLPFKSSFFYQYILIYLF